MSTKIITKHSSTVGSEPTAGDLDVAEIAINTEDKKIFTKDSSNAIVELGAPYEEGSFDVAFDGVNDGPIYTPTNQQVFTGSGRYVKVGSMVTCHFNTAAFSFNEPYGDYTLRLTPPFSVKSGTSADLVYSGGWVPSGSVYQTGDSTDNGTFCMAGSDNRIYFGVYRQGASFPYFLKFNDMAASGQGSGSFRGVSFWYLTDE